MLGRCPPVLYALHPPSRAEALLGLRPFLCTHKLPHKTPRMCPSAHCVSRPVWTGAKRSIRWHHVTGGGFFTFRAPPFTGRGSDDTHSRPALP
jgi:hypothetical protein